MKSCLKRALAALLSCALVLPGAVMPATMALAAEAEVEVENHGTQLGEQLVSDIRIDGIEKPAAGQELDAVAEVGTKEDERWDVPVLWVRDDLRIVTRAQEGRTYLPVIAFYLPEGIAIQDDVYQVRLSDDVTRLFGTNEIISVYDANTGITYILPASLRDLFAPARRDEATVARDADWQLTEEAVPQQGLPQRDAMPQVRTQQPSIIDIYCAQSARDSFSDDELEWLLDLIINRLQPQAVNLLIESFPSFRAAADCGEIGREIGLYVYYLKGDKDGNPAHNTPSEAFAYVMGGMLKSDAGRAFCYILGVELDSLTKKDADGNPVRDARTGKLSLVRDGKDMRTLENTIVHELFHAIQYDYMRTGMIGATNLNDADNPSLASRAYALKFPIWFIEGSASTVENVYQYRTSCFDAFRQDETGNLLPRYTPESILRAYLIGKREKGEDLYDDLGYSSGLLADGTKVDNEVSAYVSGYCATLYLADLAARKDGGSAIVRASDGGTSVSTAMLRMGLDSVMRRIHNGETLDAIIRDISPVDAQGARLYDSTDDFTTKFIKGTGIPLEGDLVRYQGDDLSIAFVADYLNCLIAISETSGRADKANGSILMDVDKDYTSPLDAGKTASSDYLKIVDSSEFVKSTVPDSQALQTAGKSNPDERSAMVAAGQTDADETEPASDGQEAPASPAEGVAGQEEPVVQEDAGQEAGDQGQVGDEGQAADAGQSMADGGAAAGEEPAPLDEAA